MLKPRTLRNFLNGVYTEFGSLNSLFANNLHQVRIAFTTLPLSAHRTSSPWSRRRVVAKATAECEKPHTPRGKFDELKKMVDEIDPKMREAKDQLGPKDKQVVKPLMYLIVDMTTKTEEIMEAIGGDKEDKKLV